MTLRHPVLHTTRELMNSFIRIMNVCDSCMCVPHECVWHNSSVCVTRLIHTTHELIHTTHECAWPKNVCDSWMCDTHECVTLINVCDSTHELIHSTHELIHMTHELIHMTHECVTLINVCDTTHPYTFTLRVLCCSLSDTHTHYYASQLSSEPDKEQHNARMCVTQLIRMRDTTHPWVRRDSFISAAWRVGGTTHECVWHSRVGGTTFMNVCCPLCHTRMSCPLIHELSAVWHSGETWGAGVDICVFSVIFR